jgi:uncharacterized protein YbaP (TraB family)
MFRTLRALRIWAAIAAIVLLGCDKSPDEVNPRPAPEKPATKTAQPEKPHPVGSKKGLGWKVTKNGRTLYLIGSVHVGVPALYPLPKSFDAAFDEASILVEEIDLFVAKRPENIAMMTKMASFEPGQTLNGQLSAEVQKLFANSPATRQFGPAAQNLRPLFLSVAITMQALESEGYLANLGIDQHFADRAEKRGMKYQAIETVESQLEALSGLPDKTQELMLKDTLEQLPSLERDIEKTLQAWSKGDEAAVESVMMESMRKSEFRPVYQALFLDRNEKMGKAVLSYLATAPVEFVVLGSGHLVGKDGLIHTLKDQGVTVERL